MPKKIGLYFGSFNPVHVGHLIIASFMANYTALDEVWFVVSPQNPFKKKASLLDDYHRLALVQVAIENNPKLKVSDVEFHLEKPSYTTHTLAYLSEKYPDNSFSLIMGEDNLRTFKKWKNSETIINNHAIYVCRRDLIPGEEAGLSDIYHNHNNLIFVDTPIMKISASFIRNSIKSGKDVKYFLTEAVYKYVKEMHFYKK